MRFERLLGAALALYALCNSGCAIRHIKTPISISMSEKSKGQRPKTEVLDDLVHRARLEKTDATNDPKQNLTIRTEMPNIVYIVAGDGPDGTEVTNSLRRHVGKHPVVLNYWDTWCLPCRAETPSLKAFIKKYGQRVAVYGITKDKNGTVGEYLKQHRFPLPTLVDYTNKIGKDQGINVMPTTVLYDRQGKRVYEGKGRIDFGNKRTPFWRALKDVLPKRTESSQRYRR